RAQGVCGLGPFGYSTADWGIGPANIPQPFNGPHFVCQAVQLSPPTRFAEAYGDALRAAPRLTVYLNANALRFEAGAGGGDVRQLNVGVLPDRKLTVRARIYVLAAGGIENARLLLLSRQDGKGVGNDMVGRFFMVHMEYPGAIVALASPFTDLSFHTIDG